MYRNRWGQLGERKQTVGLHGRTTSPSGKPVDLSEPGTISVSSIFSVIDRLNTPPGSPADGDAYLVTAVAGGDWALHEDEIAVWNAAQGVWEFYVPTEGWIVWVEDEDLYYHYDGSSWDVWNLNDLGDVTLTGPLQDNDFLLYDAASGQWVDVDQATVAGLLSSSSTLNDISDVTITGPVADNEVLAYDTATGEWINQTASEAGLAAAGHTHALNDLSDVTITGVADNEVLAYDTASGEWINQTAAEASLATSSHTHALNDLSDVNVGTPGAGEDGYSVTWDNTNSEYTLSNVSGGGYITSSDHYTRLKSASATIGGTPSNITWGSAVNDTAGRFSLTNAERITSISGDNYVRLRLFVSVTTGVILGVDIRASAYAVGASDDGFTVANIDMTASSVTYLNLVTGVIDVVTPGTTYYWARIWGSGSISNTVGFFELERLG